MHPTVIALHVYQPRGHHMSGKQSAETRRALRLMERDGLSMYAAAKKAGIFASTLSRHFAKSRKKTQENTVSDQQLNEIVGDTQK